MKTSFPLKKLIFLLLLFLGVMIEEDRNIKTEEIQINERRLKIKKIDINTRISNELYFNKKDSAPAGWQIPDSTTISNKGLESVLPISLPDYYLKDFRQNFSPWNFYENAIVLASVNALNKEESDHLVNIKDKLIDRLLDFTILQDGARYIVYQFDFTLDKDTVLRSPWVSGFAQGVVLMGLYNLYERFVDDRCLKVAEDIWNSFLQYREVGRKERFWVTEVDQSGYLWIEEYPLENDPQPKVLNGHIAGIFGIYNYYKMQPSKEVLLILQGAITSVHHYVQKYRVPGNINLYDLRFKTPDYGPERTILQQLALFKITGESHFLKMSQYFKKDFAYVKSRHN